MLFITSAILAFSSLAFAAPRFPSPNRASGFGSDCVFKVEENPWKVTSFTVFHASADCDQPSYVSFDFCDINKNLELETTCTRTLRVGEPATALSDSDYYDCDGEDLIFIYTGQNVTIQRVYDEPCEIAPWNARHAFGHVNLALVAGVTDKNGQHWSQGPMEVEITELI